MLVDVLDWFPFALIDWILKGTLLFGTALLAGIALGPDRHELALALKRAVFVILLAGPVLTLVVALYPGGDE